MTRKETVAVLAVLGDAFRGFVPEDDAGRGRMAGLWAEMFREEPFAIVAAAAKAHIATSRFPPTVAEIKGLILKLAAPELTELEAWAALRAAAARELKCDTNAERGRQRRELYAALPKEVRDLATWEEFSYLSGGIRYGDINPDVYGSHFMRSYRAHLERRRFEKALPPDVRRMFGPPQGDALLECGEVGG